MAIQKIQNTLPTTKAKGGQVAAPKAAPAVPHMASTPAAMKDTSHLTVIPKRSFGSPNAASAHMMNQDGPKGTTGGGMAGC